VHAQIIMICPSFDRSWL